MKTTSFRFAAIAILIVAIPAFLVPSISDAASRERAQKILAAFVASTTAEDSRLRVWVNSGDGLPIEEGSMISFHILSDEDVHLTAMYLDADGNMVLFYPGPEGTTLRGREQLDLASAIATAPYGIESLFVVGSPEPITREALGIDSQDAYPTLGHEQAVAAAEKLRDIVAEGGDALMRARVDLRIVAAESSASGYTRGSIVEYFTQPETRSVLPPKIELEINFETGSADLLHDARDDLDVVGAALSDARLADKRFNLVGHTDHRGGESYNLILSKSRAEAARRYLIEKYRIDPDRIAPIGLGESRPIEEGNDANALRRNRRVELELVR